MKQIKEGNLYNVEDEIKGKKNASTTGLEEWKREVRKQIMEKLKRQKIGNVEEIIKKTFGNMLD